MVHRICISYGHLVDLWRCNCFTKRKHHETMKTNSFARETFGNGFMFIEFFMGPLIFTHTKKTWRNSIYELGLFPWKKEHW